MRALMAIVVASTVLVGAAGGIVALQGHAGGEDELSAGERASLASEEPRQLSAARLEAFVAKAPEPVTPARRTHVAWTRCTPGGGGPLRDPWSCAIGYRSGGHAHYRVVVWPDGRYRGVGSGIIEGCCVKAPTTE